MHIAIFGKDYKDEQRKYLQLLMDELTGHKVKPVFFKPWLDKIAGHIQLPEKYEVFSSHQELIDKAEMLFSIGGDGTLLDTIPYLRGSGIPVLGINLGRLGFLSSISKDGISDAVKSIFAGEYYLDKRSLLSLEQPADLFGELNFGLNDLTIYRNNTTSLIVVHVYVDGLKLNSYWGDGLIVSTPTGSTAYSMAVGGPILSPGSRNFVIAPIASHNLTVRPIVIQDSSEIKIKIEGREERYLMTLDSRHSSISKNDEMIIRKCDFEVSLVQMNNQNFFSTIRDKLMWGRDYRN